MDFNAIISGIKIAFSVHRWTKRIIFLWNYCVQKPTKVLVLGSSGSGKTQFLNSFLGIPMLEDNRTYVPESKFFYFENGRKIKFVDLPGHITLESARQHYIDEITKNKIDGIINVVNYGYNDVEDNSADVFNIDNNEIKAAYLNDCRKNELNQLKEWLNRIHGESKPKWIITVINKADIWYDIRNEVERYYTNGDYGQQIDVVKRVVPHYLFQYCSVISPFGGRPMTIVMSERTKNELHKHFKESLLRLIVEHDRA